MGKHRGVLSLAVNVGEVDDGEADGVSKFGPEEQLRRVQEELAPITRFFVGQFLDGVGKEHSWFIALLKARKEGKLSAPFWSRTPPRPCSGWRELTNYAIDIKAKDFGELGYSKLNCFARFD